MAFILELLRKKNSQPICSVEDSNFKTYGRVIKEIDFSSCLSYMTVKTQIPQSGNVYVASVPELETKEIVSEVSLEIYGGNEIQIGYCNGRNSSLNGMEYHKGSEVFVAVTDCFLFLGHIWDMVHNRYESNAAEVFFVRAGQAIELYQTTLHLSPCKVYEEGFKSIIILPKGTNSDFEAPIKTNSKEGEILFKKNKWIITHPEWEPLYKQGVKAGIMGERIHLYYIEENESKESSI